jgi:HAD superfamily hydrolase (TIGR01548 family)
MKRVQITSSQFGLESVLPRRRPDVLLFDMDGVLADVRESYRSCIVKTVARYGGFIDLSDVRAAKRDLDSNNDWVVAQRLIERTSGREIPLDEIVSAFQSTYLGSGSRPGLRCNERLLVPATKLSDLAKRYRLGIVTGRPRDECDWFLDRFGVASYFGALVCREDAREKPHPEGILAAARALGGSTTWVFGDTVDDIRSASRADAISSELDIIPFGVLSPGATLADGTALSSAGALAVLGNSEQISSIIP